MVVGSSDFEVVIIVVLGSLPFDSEAVIGSDVSLGPAVVLVSEIVVNFGSVSVVVIVVGSVTAVLL